MRIARWAVGVLALALLGGPARAASNDDDRVRVLDATYGYWAPEIHELHVRLQVEAKGVGGEELFTPKSVQLDGAKARYSIWYFDGGTYDYSPISRASRRKIEVFIPVAWRAGEKHSIELFFNYAGSDGRRTLVACAPKEGGVWKPSDGGNCSFVVREEAGLARTAEPVEFDVTLPGDLFRDPEKNVRATLMTAPGVFKEIPCQVYGVDRITGGRDRAGNTVRFRTAVQVTLAAKQECTVVLWNCSGGSAGPGEPRLRIEGGALGGKVENSAYRIELDAKSGQLFSWADKRLRVLFQYTQEGKPSAIEITPDTYRDGQPWSHAGDWSQPRKKELIGPVFFETIRGGPMPGAPEITGRVTYRFYADRPEVRVASVMRTSEAVNVLAFRNGGMLYDASLFTHVAWPLQDGTVRRLPLDRIPGNDTGSPPAGRMPISTPWVAFYNAKSHYGMALATTNFSFYNEGAYSPNASNGMYYVSLYRGRILYTVRAINFNYYANIRTYVSPMSPATVAYEEFFLLPFSFELEDDSQFTPIEDLRQRLLKPLIVVP